jgi:hypothetical protein
METTARDLVCLAFVLSMAGCGSPPVASEPSHTPSTEATSDEPSTSSSTESVSSGVTFAELCPVLADTRPIGGSGPSLAPAGVISDLDAMIAAVPAQVGARTRGELQTVPRGIAGTASPRASTVLAAGPEQVQLDVVDLVHVCRCQPGDGLRLRAHAEASGSPAQRLELGDWPGLVTHATAGTFVHVWVADRCQVTLGGAAESSLIEVARALDWTALGRACGAPVAR